MEPDAAPCCPACGYQRTGIASGARCPECGADGLDGCLVILGSRRTQRSLLLAMLVLFGGLTFGIALQTAWRIAADSASAGSILASCLMLAVLVAIDLVLGAALLGKLPGLVPLQPRQIVWTVHPDGIEIRDGASRRSIRRDEIARIDCADSLVGSVSQLAIVRSRLKAGGIVGTTPIIYIRGEVNDRRERCRLARRTLGLDSRG